ncbi:hypothetical protein BC629DRAFT_1562128 [Irpex lacteus]|nr:hypothetical protein BC629DRAFT_1562128 [Irpex lacteus]
MPSGNSYGRLQTQPTLRMLILTIPDVCNGIHVSLVLQNGQDNDPRRCLRKYERTFVYSSPSSHRRAMLPLFFFSRTKTIFSSWQTLLLPSQACDRTANPRGKQRVLPRRPLQERTEYVAELSSRRPVLLYPSVYPRCQARKFPPIVGCIINSVNHFISKGGVPESFPSRMFPNFMNVIYDVLCSPSVHNIILVMNLTTTLTTGYCPYRLVLA